MKTTTILISCALLGGTAFVQAEGKGFGDGILPEFLAQCDLDGNGVLDEEEVQAMEQVRKQIREQVREQIDADGDGKICEQERERAREAIQQQIEAKRAEKFAAMAGEDGRMNQGEFAGIPALADVDPARIAAMFQRMDADGNGEVNLEEFMARLRHRQGPQEPGDGDGGPRPGHGGEGPGGNGEGPGDGGEGPGDGGEGPGDGGEGPGDGGEGPGTGGNGGK